MIISIYFENKTTEIMLNITRSLHQFVELLFSPILANIPPRNTFASIKHPWIGLYRKLIDILWLTPAPQLISSELTAEMLVISPLAYDLLCYAIKFHLISITWVFRVIQYTPWLFHSTKDCSQITPSYFFFSYSHFCDLFLPAQQFLTQRLTF